MTDDLYPLVPVIDVKTWVEAPSFGDAVDLLRQSRDLLYQAHGKGGSALGACIDEFLSRYDKEVAEHDPAQMDIDDEVADLL